MEAACPTGFQIVEPTREKPSLILLVLNELAATICCFIGYLLGLSSIGITFVPQTENRTQ